MDKATLHHHDFLPSFMLPTDYEVYNEKEERITEIGNFKHINLIIGANNSGKSRLIRSILRASCPNTLSGSIRGILIEHIRFFFVNCNPNINASLLDNLDNLLSITIESDIYSLAVIDSFAVPTVINKLSRNNLPIKITLVFESQPEATVLVKKINDTFNEWANKMTSRPFFLDLLNEKKIAIYYTPVIRTALRTIVSSSWEDTQRYQFDIRENIANQKTNLIWINGHDIFDNIHAKRNSFLIEDIRKIEAFQKLLSRHLFDEKEIILVAPVAKSSTEKIEETKRELFITVEGEPSIAIYNLGDGIQQMIILLWHLLIGNGGLVVIEEPETSLHPAQQKRLIKILNDEELAKNYTYFITTHSNHILDALNQNYKQTSYKILRTQKKETKLYLDEVLDGDYKDILYDLGITNSSVLLANCIIWVEGICDYIYYNKYLELYAKQVEDFRLKEGLHYGFLFTGGNNLVHLSFFEEAPKDYEEPSPEEYNKYKVEVQKLTGKAFVILDGDTLTKWPDENLEHDFGIKKENSYRLKVKEVENLLSKEKIHAILTGQFEYSEDIQSLDNIKTLENTSLVKQLIEGGFDLLCSKKLTEDRWTRNKTKIARSITSDMDWGHMTEEARHIAKLVYQFVCKQNGFEPMQEPVTPPRPEAPSL